MFVLKCNLEDVQNVKKYLVDKDYLNKDYLPRRKDNFFYFLLKDNYKDIYKNFSNFILEQKDISFFEKKKKKLSFKEELEKYFTKDEIKRIKTAYDVIGNIAIIEIDEEFQDRQEIIAKIVIDKNKNVKTVLKKADIHKGVFRTQNMTYLLGEKTKIAKYTENGVEIKLNVENVYFSPRLSTERKRISELVTDGENVIELFSGCAPYSLVISKNSNAKYIYGVELNPEGHKYGFLNTRLSKLSNIFLTCMDVREFSKNPLSSIIGLKSSIDKKAIDSRLVMNPKVFELHTTEFDFDNIEKIKNAIKYLQEKNIWVILHQPIMNSLCMLNSNSKSRIYKQMLDLANEFQIELIIHVTFEKSNQENLDYLQVVKNIKSFKNFYHLINFEHGSTGFLTTKEEILKLIKDTSLKNFCIDTCHLLHQYSPQELRSVILEIQKECNTYFHISDYDGKIHGGVLSRSSKIDLSLIVDLFTKGIVEVRSLDESLGLEMISSFNYLTSTYTKKLDRILMPLPKTAEEFLDSALLISKKGTIIHFYDFLNEKKGEIPNLAISKIDKICKKLGFKYKILNYVKCGDHAPHTYRVCIDFKIL